MHPGTPRSTPVLALLGCAFIGAAGVLCLFLWLFR